jgi:phage I-like protein
MRVTSTRAFAFAISNAAPLTIEDGKNDAWVDVAKIGEWKGYVGADGKKRTVKVTQENFKSALAEFARNGNEMVLDYEHQSLTGEKALAAGWIDELKIDGEILRGHVAFTDIAAAEVRAKQYKFTSPVWAMGEPDRVSGEILLAQIPCVALTNVPFQGGLRPVSLSRSLMSQLPLAEGTEVMTPEQNQTLLDEVMKALGVTDPATLLAAVQQLVGDAKSDVAVADVPMSVPAAMTRIKSMAGAQVSMKAALDATKSALETANKAIADRKIADEAAAAAALESAAVAKVDGLIAMGKALPGQRDHFLAFARSDAKAFDALAATLPEIVPMSKRAKPAETKGLGTVDAEHPVIASFKRSKWSDEKIAAYVAAHPDQFATA